MTLTVIHTSPDVMELLMAVVIKEIRSGEMI